jgi:hypothetical protein
VPLNPQRLSHPVFPRRTAIQAGAIGLLGLSLGDLIGKPARAENTGAEEQRAVRNVIYVFLSGGLAQHESLDMKPLAPDSIRGEFSPIATATPGTFICEHLPLLAQRSRKWSLVRSLTHSRNDHGESIHIMNTGRSNLPPGLDRNRPKPTDFPSMLSVAGSQLKGPGGLPASAVLPRLVTNVNKSQRPGQTGGLMGPRHDPWLINAAAECNGYGACPDCFYFSNKPEFQHKIQPVFQAPNLSLPDGLSLGRLDRRVDLLREVEDEQRELDRQLSVARLGRDREGALSLLTSGRIREAFDLQTEEPRRLDAYGRNVFGSSLLLARRLVDVGVRMVQVNMGRGSTWDQHGDLFLSLRKLLPPLDQSLSALIDDLDERGLLESTLVVVASEFGRTPKISRLSVYKAPGRDHWGATQSVLLAGGGVVGGRVIGATDVIGAYPTEDPQTPENFAATIYDTLGIPRSAHWHDLTDRPYPVYHAAPMRGLT